MAEAGDFVYVDSDVDTEEESEDLGAPKLVQETRSRLVPTDYDSDGSEYVKYSFSHMKGTGQWVKDADQYREWFESDTHGCLWINGMPGSGKSVVAARIASELAKDKDAVILFFFFRYIILTNRTPHDLIRDWMDQMLDRCVPLQAKLKSLMKKQDDIRGLSHEEIWKVFEASLAAMPKVHCTADALDEMETGHEKFICQLLNLGFRKPESIKVLTTSRLLARVQNHLRDPAPSSIRLYRPFVNQDITFYTRSRLVESQISIDQRDALIKIVCDKSNDLFLYAGLMLDDVLGSLLLGSCYCEAATENGADTHMKPLDRGRWYNFGGSRRRRTSEVIGASVLHGWATVQRYGAKTFDVNVLEKIGTCLLAVGCDVNVRDGAGKTPLHYIVSARHYSHTGQGVWL